MDRKRDENLKVVAALEGYSFKNDIDAKTAYDLFRRYDIFNLIRGEYDTLHTHTPDESVSFAEDALASRMKT
ncbi:MAG: DUF3791 domain-containing protein [Synergistaceae bacterium]|nr:DUF3791 domain-containing protein [Synergistaceae bacterium]